LVGCKNEKKETINIIPNKISSLGLESVYNQAKLEIYKHNAYEYGEYVCAKDSAKRCKIPFFKCDLGVNDQSVDYTIFDDSTDCLIMNFTYVNEKVNMYWENTSYKGPTYSGVGIDKKTKQMLINFYCEKGRASSHSTDNSSFSANKEYYRIDNKNISHILDEYNLNHDNVNPWLVEKLKSLNYIK
jgi:hypothetical protein